MGKSTGFMEINRQDRPYGPVADRIRHYGEFVIALPEETVKEQGARCMDCGIPFCHNGCPLNNLIPDWNDLVYRGRWREAADRLHATNNFPEFTGRVCPAPCEASCTLNLTGEPVTIKTIECAIVDRAWVQGWIVPRPPARPTGKRVAVIGSGPAGLASAQQLARSGHEVVVYEKRARVGGLLRYGIPDFKLDKRLIDRRVTQMEAEGVTFRPNSHIGVEFPARELLRDYDALVLAGGAEHPRDLSIPGRELDGVHFAMDFLTQQNDRVAGVSPGGKELTAKDKHVVVIGGGDTGSDCVGTSIRQGARSVLQIEIMPRPPEQEDKLVTWPDWPLKLRTSSSQEEGCQRDWGIASRSFVGENGKITGIELIRVDPAMKETPGSESFARADLVLLAMGFVHPTRNGLLEELGVALDGRGNVAARETGYQSSVDKVFTAGDMHTGQSLVVQAIREGRGCARAVNDYLRFAR
uniref:Glutamate synthase (NADPH/NADH) small chain n=1 Tax=Candidatus Kentrum sp. FM TaxID=2126340 RepID=A0A450TWZ9_9GAMM|nr:MAG: glutamate synthase (NADPH/NADH) small chain [Candidatus Kentron sp. FM]VFJ73648.1 MAG: glutamate synthase (NADPH/NADH) small chain [Candidatus Kentron sp. FM]VFK21126.1 MAG: glutamate synthase (NADPH/NADH) small chain [Candidatus Kentron sp. FM]